MMKNFFVPGDKPIYFIYLGDMGVFFATDAPE